jgi:hypothetical protein
VETAVKKSETFSLIIAIILVVLAVALRLLPHPANFAPIAAVAIFGGAILPRRYALSVPLAAIIVSDLVIGLHSLVLVTWSCFALIALASHQWLKRPTFLRGLALVLSSSIFFFTVSNLAVWLWSGMYAHSLAGLARCFELALPFFRNTALSDIVYSAALFGLYIAAVKAGSLLANRQPKTIS